MSTVWSISSSEMIQKALQHMGVIDSISAPNAEDFSICLTALNGLLKELPSSGYLWPDYRVGIAMSWSIGTPSEAPLPDDFYGFSSLRRADGYSLKELSPAEWLAITDQSATGERPYSFYRDGAVVRLYPVPATDPGLTISYQSIADDVGVAEEVDVPQSWLNAIPWGIASELWLTFEVPIQKGAVIEQKWAQKLAMALESASPDGPICFQVSD